MGALIGIEAITEISRQVGFGEVTGIDLPAEADGFIPSPEWKLRRHKTKWNPVDTAQCAIGQGAITTTPLQVAVATSAIAMRGKYYKPRLVANGNTQGEHLRTLPWKREHIETVVEGMEMTVRAGTGQTMQVDGIRVAGKTGTAESGVYGEDGKELLRTWFAGFFPAGNPRYVVVVMNENGVGGNRDCAPVFREIAQKLFALGLA